MLETVEQGASDASHAVIWLHGLGADGHDFPPIVPELELPPLPKVRFVFPHAPVRPVTLNGGMRMRAWYDIVSLERRSDDVAGVEESARAVRELIDREGARGVPPERVVLAGFSQGAAIALHVATRLPVRLLGVIALSGYLLLPDSLAAERSAATDRLAFFIGHGSHDPMVPVEGGRHAADRLRALGYEVDFREYPMPHSVCVPEIADIGAWLRSRLSPEPGLGV